MKVKKTRTTLSNGLPLVVIEITGSKSAVVSFWIKAGTRFNPKDKEGLAHFLEHMLLKKCKKYPSSAKLAEVLERVGAYHNGWTNRDFVHYDIDSASKDVPLTLEVLSEIISSPLIDRKDTEAEREVIRKEQIRKDSNQADLVWDVWYKIFFSDSPLEFPNIGTPESVYRINEDDLLSFWRETCLTKDSMVMVSSGRKTEEIEKLAEKNFGKLKLLPNLDIPIFNYSRKNRIIIEKKKSSQANILLTFATVAGDKIGEDLYSLVVLRNVLSSGWHSRISQRLRIKEGLIYSWGSSLERYLDTGAFTLYTATAKEKLSKLLSILSDELKKIRLEKVSEKELELAKGFIEGVNLSSYETSEDYMDWWAKDELFWPDLSESPEEFVSKIKKVSSDDVQNVSNKYLRGDNWYLSLVGEVKEKDINIDL